MYRLRIPTINADTLVSTAVARNAAAILIILPLMLVYVVCQRFFIQSIEQTGIVGWSKRFLPTDL